ncbi:MAG: hypothetical protein E7319_03465 [Clostridiales bacterium]|nr:hypothetical protein [Clostridiales bacterium]
MKKALLAAVCFILVCLVLINGTFALPDLDEVFADLTGWLGEFGLPEQGGAGTPVHVALVSDHTPQQLYPGGSASRVACVQNQGEGKVYFRLVYAIQYDADSWPELDIDFSVGNGFITHDDWIPITIDQTPYRMKAFTYIAALDHGVSSPEVTLTITMSNSITSEQLARYRKDFVQMQVLAIDPTPFSDVAPSAVEALNMALPLDTLNPF